MQRPTGRCTRAERHRLVEELERRTGHGGQALAELREQFALAMFNLNAFLYVN